MKKQVSGIFYKLGFFLMLLGILLRLGRMFISFDYEESYSVITSNPALPLMQIIKDWLIIDVHPPLFNILLWGWNHLVPYPHEVWMRVFPFLITILSLLASYFLFPVRYGKTARFLFLGCVSIMWHNVYYGAYVRSYSLLLLVSIVLMFASLRILNCFKNSLPVSRWDYLLFFGTGTVAVWTHYFGLLLFAICVYLLLWAALYFKQKIFPFLVGSILVFLIISVWIVPNFLYNLQIGHFSGKWWANEEIMCIKYLWFFYQFFFGRPWIGSIIAIGGFVLAFYYYKNARTLPYASYLFDLAFCISVFLLILLATGFISIKTYMFIPRFFIASFPALYILFSILLGPLAEKKRWVLICILVFWSFTLATSWKDFLWYLHREPNNIRNIAEYFMEKRPNKETELYILMKEGYPSVAQKAMISVYINDYFKQNVSITILTNLSKEERAKKLQNKNAIIMIPMCYPEKVDKISTLLGERYFIKKLLHGSCEVTLNREEANPVYEPESRNFSLFI